MFKENNKLYLLSTEVIHSIIHERPTAKRNKIEQHKFENLRIRSQFGDHSLRARLSRKATTGSCWHVYPNSVHRTKRCAQDTPSG